jgi:uncharacterized protein (TIGR03437 family)
MTVANFMTYVCSGAYTAGDLSVNGEQVPYVSTIIHRSLTVAAAVPPYVIQGGGYALNGLIPALIVQNSAVTSEFNLANCPNMTCNVRGTIAMALYNGNVDSATDQWYFNTADNSSTLDSQDFTVFGNVANNPSLAVMDAINTLTTWNVDYGQDADFANLPLMSNYTCPNATSCPLIKADNYVYVNSITSIVPADSAAGVADSATAANNIKTGISPGEILTLYGANLGPAQVTTLTLNSAGTAVTTSLEGTEVLFNGVAGPMIFTLDGQIAVVAPYEIAGQSTVNVVVSYLGLETAPVQFNVVPATPGLFTLNETGKGDAAIIRLSDSSVISTSNPASAGDTLELYGEGYGVASSSTSLPDGAVVGGTGILPVPAATTVLLIDGQPVSALYAGGAGGDVNGVLQVNFVVPQLSAGSHQIQVKVGSAVSPTGVNLQTK